MHFYENINRSVAVRAKGQEHDMEEKRVYLSQRVIIGALLIVWSTLWFASIIHDIVIFSIRTDSKIWRLDVSYEDSFYNWFSTIILAFSSGILLMISSYKFSDNDKFKMQWLILGLGFLFMSMDESLSFHEQLSEIIADNIDNSGIFYFPWVIFGLVIVFLLLVFFWNFLKNLDRRFAVLFIASGSIFIFGALGMEMIAGIFLSDFDTQNDGSARLTPIYRILTNVEEGLEAGGVILFIYSLLEYCRRYSINFIHLRR